MQTMNVRSWVRSCCLATLAAASVGVTSVAAQSGASEPEGMPVYRQKKSTFFQNPFSTTYQKIWNRAKGETAPQAQQYQTGDMTHATNAGYASDEGQIVGIEGEPTMLSASPTPTSTPTKRWSSQSASNMPGKSTEMLMAKPRKTTAKGIMQGQMRHTASKPTAQQMMRRPNQQQSQMQPAEPGTGADRVIHVTDVNEGTPAIGSEVEVQANAELLKTLAPGEEIKSVKERVIGVYRDGKLVPVNAGTRTTSVPTSMPPAKQVPAAQQEVDPWFGDTVNAPSAEVQGIDSKEETIEALPPQSYMTEPVMPALPPEEGTIYVEQTSFHAQPKQPVQQQPQPVKVAKSTFAAPPDGEAMQMVPAQGQMRRTATPTKMKQVSPEVLKKYQTNYRGR